METNFTVRNLSNENIIDVMNIQKRVYNKDLQEESFVFIQILEVFPEGVFGVFENNTLAGYLFSHPYFQDKIKPLNNQLFLTGDENCIYLHDMAISPDYQGKGLTKRLFERFPIVAVNNNYEIQCLVAVQDSYPFWNKFGFVKIKTVNKEGYLDAVYCKRNNSNNLINN